MSPGNSEKIKYSCFQGDKRKQMVESRNQTSVLMWVKRMRGSENRRVLRLKFILSNMLKPGASLNLKLIRLAIFCLFYKWGINHYLLNIYWTCRIFLVVVLILGILIQIKFCPCLQVNCIIWRGKKHMDMKMMAVRSRCCGNPEEINTWCRWAEF